MGTNGPCPQVGGQPVPPPGLWALEALSKASCPDRPGQPGSGQQARPPPAFPVTVTIACAALSQEPGPSEA